MSTTNDLKIIAVDTTTGEERESYDLAKSDAFTTETPLAIPNWHMTKVSSDGKMCVICMGDKIVALDDSGKEKWRVTSGNGDQVYVFPPQPLVAEGLSVYSLASQKLYSIQFSNGKPTGGLPIVDFQSIRATTSDGTKCAVAEKNGMVIRSLDPTDKSSVLIDLDMQCYFSDDGKLLYGMPTMKALSFDQKTNTATLGRAESSFFMFDAATGKQVKKIAISHP
jgi:outer membrane protein assembly factor BamB